MDSFADEHRVMPLSLQHRHAVLLAGRSRGVRTIITVIIDVPAANPETTALDIETALRAAAGQLPFKRAARSPNYRF